MSDIPLEHMQRVARQLHEQGTEMTLEEIDMHRKAAFAKIRKEIVALGWNPPEGDNEFLIWLQTVLGRR